MNRIRVSGNLTNCNEKHVLGYRYSLEVVRRPGAKRGQPAKDTLMVLSRDPDLLEGDVLITGSLEAVYMKGFGVPVFIVPESVEAAGSGTMKDKRGQDLSESVITGTVKEKPACRKTRTGKPIANVRVMTDKGPVPVVLWDKKAEEAPGIYDAGDVVQVRGRLQSREYPLKKGGKRTTYEVSSSRVEILEKGK